MGAWDDLAVTDAAIEGYEGATLTVTANTKAKAKDLLRTRLRPSLRPLIGRAGVQEEIFYDGMAALADTTEVYQMLLDFLTRETLGLHWAKSMARQGVGSPPTDRHKYYDGLLKRDVPDFPEMVRRAMDEDELTFSATRSETSSAPLWAIA